MVGKTISHYKVLEKIGEGGMGEVYRATDTKLNRDVALKILPEQFASDSQRMGRFQREAEVLASLDHPNIGQTYGIEEAGQTKALVLQLIEGPTLAERIAQGPIPVEEALKIALQIAEGLEAAHEKGVIHRDLKPANIKVNPEGQVKILDFGLAKALEVEVPASSLSQSPTLTNAATQAGVILGTAAYMSPEQARGREVDSRTDVWAFGCVLYEMLTGQPAFGGEDVTVTLARIVEREPNLDALPAAVPSSIQQALRLCLRKDVKRRFSDIRDVRLMLEGEFETAGVAELFSVAQPKWRRVLVSMVMLLLGALIAGTVAWLSTAPPTPQVTRLTITPSPTAPLAIDGLTRDLAISPDGTAVAYIGSSGTSLVVRLMDQNEPAVITGITPRHPVFSPDGESIFFFDGGTLKRVARSGGPVLTLSQGAGASRGASWGPDDRIVFATSDANTGLLRVGSAGGEPEVLTTPDQTQGEVCTSSAKVRHFESSAKRQCEPMLIGLV